MVSSTETNDTLTAVEDNPYLRAVVSVTCVLSVVGSILIVLTYCCFKSLRNRVRLILVHLSLMDLGVATANLVGVSINFHQFYLKDPPEYRNGLPQVENVSQAVHIACLVQAGVAIYCTLSSFMWTLGMAVFLYFRIVHHRAPGAAKRVLLACTLCCYAFPLALTTWKFATHRVGYSPLSSVGFCSEKFVDTETGQRYIIMAVIGYDMWVYLTYILVPVLYVAIYLHVQEELQRSVQFMPSEKFWALLHNLDYKLLLIPAMFLLLRIWSCLIIVFHVYVYLYYTPPKYISTILMYLSGIGDSGQGAVNAMLFVFSTKRVRHKLLPCCYKKSVLDNSSLQAPSINAGSTASVQKYLIASQKSAGRYINSYSSSDSD